MRYEILVKLNRDVKNKNLKQLRNISKCWAGKKTTVVKTSQRKATVKFVGSPRLATALLNRMPNARGVTRADLFEIK